METTATGQIVAAWWASADADFGGGTTTPDRMAIVTYDAAGTYQAARLLSDGGALALHGMRLAAAPGGQLRVAAALTGTIDLGTGPITPSASRDLLAFSMTLAVSASLAPTITRCRFTSEAFNTCATSSTR